MNMGALHDAIAAVCPLAGISIGSPSDKSTWRIDYDLSATDAQKVAAQSVVSGWTEPVAPRMATGKQLCEALADLGQLAAWDAAIQATRKPEDRLYWQSSYRDAVPESNAKIGRIASACGVSVAALFDKAVVEPLT